MTDNWHRGKPSENINLKSSTYHLHNGKPFENTTLKSSAMQKCEGKSALGYDREEAGYKWDCKAYSVRPEDWWVEENNVRINNRWSVDDNALKAQKERARLLCDQMYNAPWIGTRRICNGAPHVYWGEHDGSFVPDNKGDVLWFQCMPGDECSN